MGEQAGTWIRVSSTGQDEGNQVPDITAWCDARGYDVPAGAQYVVHGRSAYKGNKAFDAAWNVVLDDLRAGRITVLVVWKQDRIDRKLNTFQMLAQVVEAGGRVEFVTQPHLNDLTTMGGRISLKVQEEIAYAESKDKSDRVRAAMATTTANGALWGRPPFGYANDGDRKYGHRLVTTELGEKYVPEVFRKLTAGETLASIALWLTAEGVPTGNKAAHDWSANRVGAIVRCPTYKGQRRAWDAKAKRYGAVIHQCPALVDAGVWAAANKALDARPGRGRRSGTKHATALLSGVLACPGCNGPMYRVFNGPAARRSAYYRCCGTGAVRSTTCKVMVLCSTADGLAGRFMAGLASPVLREVTTPGHDHAAELETIADALRDLPALGLDEDAEDDRRAELRAERKRLAALPSVPTRTELVATDETYSDVWNALPAAERNAWLRGSGITFRAAPTARGLAETWHAGLHWPDADTSRLLTGDGVSVVVSWLMSGLYDAEDAGAA